MALLELWKQDQAQLVNKNIQQLISFAGEGHLHDDNTTSHEFRELLRNIPPEMIQKYAHQCLEQPFNGSGFALQDVVNEIGRRLDFDVVNGRYQGRQGVIGFDGLWKWKNNHNIVIEVKTTDAYRINIDTIAGYRRALIEKQEISELNSSILIVVGREDTGGLEAQLRGSRHAWDMRLISVESLCRLMLLKRNLEDLSIIQKMFEILVPKEFTKLDGIVDLVFSTAEDIKIGQIGLNDINEPGEEKMDNEPPIPVAFHNECAMKLETYFHKSLIPKTRVLYSSADKEIALVCLVSKEYDLNAKKSYWFGFHPYQKEFMHSAKQGFLALGCGTVDILLLLDIKEVEPWLNEMNKTERPNRYYWHIRIEQEENKLMLRLKNQKSIDLSSKLI
jgi:hypothetical protein